MPDRGTTVASCFSRRALALGAPALAAGALARPARAEIVAAGRAPPLPHLIDVATASRAEGQPEASLAALDKALAAAIGHKLFTVLVINWAKNENQRFYTNQPGPYPTGGAKPLVRQGEFFQEVVLAGRPRICRTYDDVKRAFFDHELIRSLGCESAVNYPVRWNGRTIGSLNLLHQAEWYREDDMPALSAFAQMTVPALMEIVSRA